MNGTVKVNCQERTCAWSVNGRCVAQEIELIVEIKDKTRRVEFACDTYEHEDLWFGV